MIFRITDYVHYGTLDNRKRGTVHLTLQLMGMPHPVNITLHGDCLQDLAGCVVDFRNPSPQMLPAELTQIPEHIQGVAGDMTASRRMPVKGKKTMENALYLEWFTSHHDMVLLESTVFSIKVSLPEWMMDSCEEQAQIMANQQMLRTQVKEWSRAYSNHQEDGSLPDHHWDKRLREAEAIAIAYQEVFQKYRLNPSGDIRVAFVMGWDEVLDNIAQSEETGDVIGFIENKGHNYKCKGCWKVYCNECETQKTFQRYQKCRNVYLRLWKQGRSVLQLTVAV